MLGRGGIRNGYRGRSFGGSCFSTLEFRVCFGFRVSDFVLLTTAGERINCWTVQSWAGGLGGSGRLIDPRPIGRQAAAAGPLPQVVNRFRRGDGDRYHVLRCFGKRDIQQGGQPATRLDLGPRPIPVHRDRLIGRDVVVAAIQLPDCLAFGSTGKIHEENRVETLGAGELRRQPTDVVRRADEEHVGFVIGQPAQQGSEQPCRDTRIATATHARQAFL